MNRIVKSEPFHIQAYKSIQKSLLENEFIPGQRITETGLAEKVGVSRGPIREAVRMLTHDGLLYQEKGHIYVFDPTFENVVDLYLCKERLEPLGAKLSAQKITNSDKQKLEKIITDTKDALKNGNQESVVELNTEFHDLIAQTSNNNQLVQFMDLIRAKTIYMRNNILSDYIKGNSFLEEHQKIAEAIIDGDSELAEAEMRQHIHHDIKMLDEVFSKTEHKLF
ncbi:GntR family transcriptional regulator [Virgibacillus ihumii]|uniref:GntR family transcriptional regulator n=1 Tax=Virgibacillus ihumii TaxID=2686091 RepID=UPI00157DBE84|nr:GntR family transcriptional regulator [Virgibacillus ihumii]